MTTVRTPAVAGLFYPDDPRELKEMIAAFMEQAQYGSTTPKALIAPHAGYIYSGAVAASAYACLKTRREIIRRVVLLGPSHRVALSGLAISGAECFTTPLGSIPVDKHAVDGILSLPQVQLLDEAHTLEHSLEVQLPFLQELLGAFSLIPIVVGEAQAMEVGEVLDVLWGGDETLIVVSSDLSHYHDYDTARRLDHATSQAIEALRPEDIHHQDACGRNPINGLLVAARKHKLKARIIDIRNSGDTAGPHDRVVGYGAYLFEARE